MIDNAGNQVAEWHGLIDPDLLAGEVARLGTYYNQGIIGVEVNNQGRSTADHLKIKYPLHKLYHREVLDENFRTMTKKLGWLTNVATRQAMIGELIGLVRTHGLKVKSAALIEECMSFVRDKQGKPGAQPGCHDDRVMAMAIAVQMKTAFPYLVEHPPAPPLNDQQKAFKAKMKKLKEKQLMRVRYANKY